MSEPYYEDDLVTLYHGDCIDVMRSLPDSSVDSVVTDPPYGLGFMGKEWDHLPPGLDFAVETLRVLKPGGHLLAFGGTRTWHRLAVAIEDAGFEIRDSIAWLYSSGFPKSHDVAKAIDKENGRKFEDRYALGRHIRERREAAGLSRAEVNGWFGYRDGCEHWERQDPSGARVPTLADFAVLRVRLGLSDDWNEMVERIEADRAVVGARSVPKGHAFAGSTYGGDSRSKVVTITEAATDDARNWAGWGTALKPSFEPVVVARKPLTGTVAANVLAYGTGALNIDATRIGDRHPANAALDETHANQIAGGARYFFASKAGKRERPVVDGIAHPTVKPLDLMRWLVRLTTPPGGVILEPFAGSGTTVEAAVLEGFRCVAVERESEYLPLIEVRLARASAPNPQQAFDFGEIA